MVPTHIFARKQAVLLLKQSACEAAAKDRDIQQKQLLQNNNNRKQSHTGDSNSR